MREICWFFKESTNEPQEVRSILSIVEPLFLALACAYSTILPLIAFECKFRDFLLNQL